MSLFFSRYDTKSPRALHCVVMVTRVLFLMSFDIQMMLFVQSTLPSTVDGELFCKDMSAPSGEEGWDEKLFIAENQSVNFQVSLSLFSYFGVHSRYQKLYRGLDIRPRRDGYPIRQGYFPTLQLNCCFPAVLPH